MRPGWCWMWVIAARKSSTMGSIRGEWKAWLTVSRWVRIPCSVSRVLTWSMASVVPARTREVGELMAAMVTSSSGRSVMVSRLVWAASMAPPAGRLFMSWARAVTRVQASVRVRMPETWAAVISPMECPAR